MKLRDVGVATIMREPINIDSEFASLIPALSSEERAQLERNLKSNGCREPLVVWAEQDTLIDGHNRLEICQANGLEFTVRLVHFAERDDAKRWVIQNQLGRRNLTPESIAYLRGKLYLEEKKAHGGDRKSNGSSCQSDNLKTESRLAEQFKVSPRTINRDAKFSQAIDKVADVIGVDFRKEALSRDTKVTRKDVEQIAALPPEEMPEAVRDLEDRERGVQRKRRPQARLELVRDEDTSPKLTQVDQVVRDAVARGMGSDEIAKEYGFARHQVQHSKKKLGLTKYSDTNPLKRLTDFAVEFDDSLRDAVTITEANWANASADQFDDALEKLNQLKATIGQVVQKLRSRRES